MTAHTVYAVYGVPQATASGLSALFRSLQLAHSVATPKQVTRVPGTDAPVRPVVCVGADLVRRKAAKITKRPVALFVVDNPVSLTAVGATLLSTASVGQYAYEYSPILAQDVELALDYAQAPVELVPRKDTVIADTLRASKGNSVLSTVQTLLYRIPNPDRKVVQVAFYKYLLGSSHAVLNRALHGANKPSLFNSLVTPSVTTLRSAVAEVRQGARSVSAAAKANNVAAFDIRYVLSQQVNRH